MEAVYLGDRLCGMTFVFLMNDLVYLSYICVSEAERGRRIGSRILHHLYETYPDRRFIVDIEEVKQEDENYEEEVKRRSFYIRFGRKPIYL